jgi:hypothetical protein
VIALTEKGVVVVVVGEIVVVVGTTNVRVQILGFDAQIIEEGPFNAAADRVAEQSVVAVIVVVEKERPRVDQKRIDESWHAC